MRRLPTFSRTPIVVNTNPSVYKIRPNCQLSTMRVIFTANSMTTNNMNNQPGADGASASSAPVFLNWSIRLKYVTTEAEKKKAIVSHPSTEDWKASGR